MIQVPVRFIVGKVTDEELNLLEEGYSIISKLLLTPDDLELFTYQKYDSIEIETINGNRKWCIIKDLEIVSQQEQAIIIFTLIKKNQ